jgi:5-formyltetrahydrofolate cyclo-ligase
MTAPSRADLRSEMRRRRRALTAAERESAAKAALAHFRSAFRLREGAHIGIYLSAKGELDTTSFIELMRRRNCRLYVPVVRGTGRTMRFMPLEGPLRKNRFGISEPRFDARRCIDPRALDLVLMPLVAFDFSGERLGSGAGYYDRTFSFSRARKHPRLIGLAYSWQGVETLERAPWDVPMHAVVTDAGVLRFRHR